MKDIKMFTIDLLRGQGLPIKSKPEGIAIIAVTFAVPLIVVIVTFGFYLSSSIGISITKQEIVKCEKEIGKLSGAVELQKSFEKEKIAISSSLSEVSSFIGQHTQWSPVLVTLVENMPDSLVLTKLEVKQQSVKRKVPQKNDPQKMVDVSVLVRVLHMSVSGSPQRNCDKAVRDFRDRLRLSTLLAPKLEDIRVSQKVDTLEGREVVSYGIECIFKPTL